MKKALSVLLSILLLAGMFTAVPVVTHAAEPTGSCGAAQRFGILGTLQIFEFKRSESDLL